MLKVRWAGIAAVVLAPLVVTGCASNHAGFDSFGHKKKSKTVAYPLTERTCLMRAMYFESNRSSRDGMVAVGTVVMNRVNSTAYPKTICGVVGQPNQFAPGVLTRPMTESASVARVEEAADAVLRGERAKKSKNAMFFHTAGMTFPYKNMHYVQVAGGNAFYEKRGRDGQLQVPVNDAPYDVAFAFSQERSGNVPQFTTPGRTQTAAPKVVAEPAPVMVAQAEPAPALVNQVEPAPAPVMVAQADYRFVPTPTPAPVDRMQTSSVALGYAMPSKQKVDEIGAILQKQEKTRRF